MDTGTGGVGMEKDKSLIIWNKNGLTMKFEKVTNFIED